MNVEPDFNAELTAYVNQFHNNRVNTLLEEEAIEIAYTIAVAGRIYKVITTRLENNTYEYKLTELTNDNIVYAILTKNQAGGRRRRSTHRRTRRRRATRRHH